MFDDFVKIVHLKVLFDVNYFKVVWCGGKLVLFYFICEHHKKRLW